jgi:hypothetical protein
MNQPYPTGLGEPEVIGKQALFQPPRKEKSKLVPKENKTLPKKPEKRVRMTMEITKPALVIIQQVQSSHRLLTGQVLPKWRIINDALELYGRERQENYEHSDQ